MKKNLRLVYILLAALLLRLFLVYFQYSGDTQNHLAWATSFLNKPLGLYTRSIAGFETANYPPLAVYLFSLFRLIYHLFTNTAHFLNRTIKLFPSKLIFLLPTLNMQVAFLKLPAILADLGIGLLIFKFLNQRFTQSKSLLYTSLFLFNPAVIYISTIWGQIESLPVFFVLLSIYFIKLKSDHKSSYYLSHLSFLLAILCKQTALWLAPALLIFWLKNSNLKSLLKGLIIQLLAFVILYLPFTGFNFQAFPLYLSTLQGSSQLVSDSAWNLWHLIFKGRKIADSTAILGFPVRFWSLLLLSVFYTKSLFDYYQAKKGSNLFKTLLILSLSAFFFQTRVHERHLFPALAFLLLTPFSGQFLQIPLYLSLSAFHFANLYWTLNLPFI